MGAEVYHALKGLIKAKYGQVGVWASWVQLFQLMPRGPAWVVVWLVCLKAGRLFTVLSAKSWERKLIFEMCSSRRRTPPTWVTRVALPPTLPPTTRA